MAQVYCRKCYHLVDEVAASCPKCRASDPGRLRRTAHGMLFVVTALAGVPAGAYSLGMSLVWDRWQAKFDALADTHPLSGAALETAVGIGGGVFLLTWVVGLNWCWNRLRRSAGAGPARL